MKTEDVHQWAELSNEIGTLRKELRKVYNKLHKKESLDSLIVRAVKESLEVSPREQFPKPSKSRRKNIQEAWLCLSDWQIGKKTDSYNTQVAIERMSDLCDKVEQIVEERQSYARLDTLHVILQGDMVEGETIFAGQPFEIDADLWQQAIRTVPEMIYDVLNRMSRIFSNIKVAAVAGNHGRSGTKNSGHNRRANWDLVSYEIGKLICERSGLNLDWDISDTWFVKQEVAGHGILCVHGDQIGGGNPLPLTSINKKANGWTHNVPDWSYLSVGHHHSHASGELNEGLYFFLSGSPESGNEFAREKMGQGSLPSQRLAIFDRPTGLVSEHRLILS